MAAAEMFMDSAGFLALCDAGDEHHPAAIRLQDELVRKRRRFLTSEYVVDETATLLLVRHSHAAAVDFLDTIERSVRPVPQTCRQGMVVHRLRQLCRHARVAHP